MRRSKTTQDAADRIMTYGDQRLLLEQAQAAFLMIYSTVPNNTDAAKIAAEWNEKIAEARSGRSTHGQR